MHTSKEKIISKAIELLFENSNGIRYSDLVRRIHEEFLDITINTINGVI